jgi:hypothetical protein
MIGMAFAPAGLRQGGGCPKEESMIEDLVEAGSFPFNNSV